MDIRKRKDLSLRVNIMKASKKLNELFYFDQNIKVKIQSKKRAWMEVRKSFPKVVDGKNILFVIFIRRFSAKPSWSVTYWPLNTK